MKKRATKSKTASTGQAFLVEHYDMRDTEILLCACDPADPSAPPLAERVYSIGAEFGADEVLRSTQVAEQAKLDAAEDKLVERAAARLAARTLAQGLK